MRIRITLESTQPVTLPLSYNHILQGVIYHHLSPSLATFLHEKGYRNDRKVFRMFCFSRLEGQFNINKGNITFHGPFSFLLCSPVDDVLSQFASSILRQEMELNGQSATVTAIEVQTKQIQDEAITITMLSPVTLYTTFEQFGKKKTYYYTPHEAEFNDLLHKNLVDKYQAFYPDSDPTRFNTVTLTPLNVRKGHERVVHYKNFIIKGWTGSYRLEGHPELLQFAYQTGLGGKNSQGFGCFEQLPVRQ